MDFWQIILTPFSWLLKVFCQFTDSYGLALILFTIIIKIILFPLSLKGKKSMIKMSMVNGQLQEIQKRCGNDRERYNQEVQKFYADNNISPMGGCGWSMIPLLILMPLYSIICRPMKHMMRLTEEGTGLVAKALGWVGDFSLTAGAGVGGRSAAYNELTLSAMMNAENLSTAKNAVTAAGMSAASMFVINFNFLGINLADIPNWKFWVDFSWNSLGLFLLPIISAVLSYVSMVVSQKTNQMNKNDAAAKNPTNRGMMIISPLISLWIGFTMPAGLCIYWIANSVLMMVQEWLCGRILRKDYEAAAKAMEEQAAKAKEEEKQRRREAAERKAAAIAANKGKNKKVQPQAKAKSTDVSASREGLRSYARGRAYDPDRYVSTPYHDPNEKAQKPEEEKPTELTEEEKQILAEAGVDIPVEVEETAAEVVEAVETVEEGFEEAYAPESEDEETNA